MIAPPATETSPSGRSSAWLSPPRARSLYSLIVMCVAVFATYQPSKHADFPPDARPVLLGLDFMNLHVRRLRYVHDTLFGAQGYLPGWYTRELGGSPFWSNLQSFPLIPTRLLILIARPENAFGIAVQLAANLAAIFMFLYCRKLGVGRVGGAVAGFTFACSGFFASRVFAGHLPLLEVYCALPLLLWLIEVNLQAPAQARFAAIKLLACALAAFCVAVAGHPQLPIYALSIAGLNLLFRACNRRGLMIGAAMLLGIGTASFVLYPMLLLIGRSTRILALDPPSNDLAFPYGRIAAFLFPDIHGKMPPDFHGYPDMSYFWDTVCYVGLLPIVACVALLARWIITGRRPAGVWMFLALAGVLSLAFALPAWHSLMQKIPGTILRSPSRQIYITTFALAIAGGVGVDWAINYARSSRRAWMLVLVAIALAAQAWDLGYRHDRKFITALAVPNAEDATAEDSLARDVGIGRAAIGYDIWKTYNRQIDDIGVFDSILLAKPYRAIMEVTDAPPKLNVQNFDGWQLNVRANQFFGVRVMISRVQRSDLQEVARAPGLFVYVVPDPLPRAALVPVSNTLQVSEAEIHKRLRDQTFDPSRQLLLPEGTPAPIQGTPPIETPRVDWKRPTTDQIRVDVVSPWPAYLRLLDSWDPGWSATVDGSPAPIARAYDTFLAVPVPAGAHKIELVYQTPGLVAGVILTSLCLVGLAGLCWMNRRGWETHPARRVAMQRTSG